MIPALLLGLAGSLHCAAMCGGFTWAFPRPWLYLLGRLLGYLSVAYLLQLLGRPALDLLGSPLVLAACGVGLLAMLLARRPVRAENSASLLGWLWLSLGPWLRQPGPGGRLLFGLVTALFPCGLLGSAYLQSLAYGPHTMLAFWLGSLPGLLYPRLLFRWIPSSWATRIQWLAMGTAALWMLLQALWPQTLPIHHPSCGAT